MMPRTKTPLIILISLFALMGIFCAQPLNAATKASKSAQQIIPEKDLQELIKTLEDPKKRAELIKTLKALSQAQKLTQEAKTEEVVLISGLKDLSTQFVEAFKKAASKIKGEPHKLIEVFEEHISQKGFLYNMLTLLISCLGGTLIGRWSRGKLVKIKLEDKSKLIRSVLSNFINSPITIISVYVLYNIILLSLNHSGHGYDIISDALTYYLLYTLISACLSIISELTEVNLSNIISSDTMLSYIRRLQNITKYICISLFFKSIFYAYGFISIFILPLIWLLLLVIGFKGTSFISNASSHLVSAFQQLQKTNHISLTQIAKYILTLLIWVVIIDEIIQSMSVSLHLYYAIKKTLIYVVAFSLFHYLFDLIYKSVLQSKVYSIWEQEVGSNISMRVLRLIRNLIYWGIFVFVAFSVINVWALYLSKDISSLINVPIVSKLINVAIVIAICLSLYKLSGLISYLIFEGKIRIASEIGQRRLKTLMPVIDNGIKVAVVFVGGILVLKYLGVDVGPILAGAGIVGLAVGFGAQAFVKDLINGLFIILEEAFHVGDYVEMAGKSGVVEMIGIRTTKLRDLRGNLHIIPNSSIELITNMTRDYSMTLIEIGVAYKEDVDQVMEILRTLGEEMMNEPQWGNDMLEPIEILGLDRFEDSQVVITLRIKTRPRRQWAVKREFLRRVKKRFDQLNIEIPFPHITLFMGTDKEGKAPPMYVNLKKETKDE